MNISSRITVYWITHACAMCISIHCIAHHRITQVIYEGWCTCLCIFNWITQVTLPVYWIKLVDALACASQLRSPGANQVPLPAPGHKYLWENLATNICPQNQMRIFGYSTTKYSNDKIYIVWIHLSLLPGLPPDIESMSSYDHLSQFLLAPLCGDLIVKLFRDNSPIHPIPSRL